MTEAMPSRRIFVGLLLADREMGRGLVGESGAQPFTQSAQDEPPGLQIEPPLNCYLFCDAGDEDGEGLHG
jgi:hypothetical protein